MHGKFTNAYYTEGREDGGCYRRRKAGQRNAQVRKEAITYLGNSEVCLQHRATERTVRPNGVSNVKINYILANEKEKLNFLGKIIHDLERKH